MKYLMIIIASVMISLIPSSAQSEVGRVTIEVTCGLEWEDGAYTLGECEINSMVFE